MRYLLILILIITSINAIEKNPKLFECSKIFEQRKGELLVELERIDEQQQALNALKSATDNMLKKKESALTQKEQELDLKLQEITEKEASIKELLEQNKKILEETKGLKLDKISQTYAKMKPASAASILNNMDTAEATNILKSLNPKTVGKIFSKMDSKKASDITLKLNSDIK